MDSNPNEL
jgi:hypothetical protein